jgi:hypothetical protein
MGKRGPKPQRLRKPIALTLTGAARENLAREAERRGLSISSLVEMLARGEATMPKPERAA